MIPHHLSEPLNSAINALSVGALLATLVGWLPHIGALLSIVWFGLKIALALQELRLNRRKLDQ